MIVRDVQTFLAEQYGTEVSVEFNSSVSAAVMEEVTARRSRPLESMFTVVIFDALQVKIREDALVRNKAIYSALGLQADSTRAILGLWIENTEGAKFWLKVFNDLKTCGVSDILITVTDRFKGIPEALEAMFPATDAADLYVHLIRNSLDYANQKNRKLLAAALRPVTRRPSAEAAIEALDAFDRCPRRRKVPGRRGDVAPAPGVGPDDLVLRLSAGGAAGGPHNQRD